MSNHDQIKIVRHSTAADFLQLAKDLLLKNEAEYSLLFGLTLMRTTPREKPDDYVYLQIFDGDKLVSVCVVTDKNTLLTETSEDMIVSIVNYLDENKIVVAGVVGPVKTCESFERQWKAKKNVQSELAMSQKMYALDKVISPKFVSGKLIQACSSHHEIVGQWIYEFVLECLPHEPIAIEEAMKAAPLRVQKGDIYLWQSAGGKITSMNSVGRPTENTITVSLVYTPKVYRKQGYASALVAATSQLMLDQGRKYCVLYTDAANPSSNKIYQEVGYQQVATSVHYLFKNN